MTMMTVTVMDDIGKLFRLFFFPLDRKHRFFIVDDLFDGLQKPNLCCPSGPKLRLVVEGHKSGQCNV